VARRTPTEHDEEIPRDPWDKGQYQPPKTPNTHLARMRHALVTNKTNNRQRRGEGGGETAGEGRQGGGSRHGFWLVQQEAPRTGWLPTPRPAFTPGQDAGTCTTMPAALGTRKRSKGLYLHLVACRKGYVESMGKYCCTQVDGGSARAASR
jgi:hypothetical protein